MSAKEDALIDLDHRAISALLCNLGRVRLNVPAEQVTTFGLGGALKTVIEPGSLEGLAGVLHLLNQEGRRFRLLGAGSNLIIDDAGIDEPVIALGKPFGGWLASREPADLTTALPGLLDGSTKPVQETFVCNSSGSCLILAGAGASLMSLSRLTAAQGLSGLEFAAGIPASVGGAVLMNAGAHGGAIGDIVRRIAVLTPAGRLEIRRRADLPFSYRHSGLTEGQVVIAAEFELQSGDPAEIQQRRSSCLEFRKRTQPLSLPSAGSVFRNPAGEGAQKPRAAAELLEELGFKGRAIGAVGFSELHVNWLVKLPSDKPARAAAAAELIRQAQQSVAEHFAVELKPEIVFWNNQLRS